jgi:hypothetical protein
LVSLYRLESYKLSVIIVSKSPCGRLETTGNYTYCLNNPMLLIDPDGNEIIVPDVRNQNEVLSAMKTAFGANGKNFSFDSHFKLNFTGDVSSFSKGELQVFIGLKTVMDSKDLTYVDFSRSIESDTHGGEITKTMTDNPKASNNQKQVITKFL